MSWYTEKKPQVHSPKELKVQTIFSALYEFFFLETKNGAIMCDLITNTKVFRETITSSLNSQ